MRKCRHLAGAQSADTLVRVRRLIELDSGLGAAEQTTSLTALCEACAESLETVLSGACAPFDDGGNDGSR